MLGCVHSYHWWQVTGQPQLDTHGMADFEVAFGHSGHQGPNRDEGAPLEGKDL